eukprot:m.108825 g.108825  ORF g.108825 m.108825 type:complete len:514 (+) comp27907_c0_seq1:41-1582(+)
MANTFALVLGCFFATVSSELVVVNIGKQIATTADTLTSVTIDVCALKEGLDFNNSKLVTMTSHLAPGVIRIGGSDQNSFSYNMSSNKKMDCVCGKNCVMTAPYWDTVLKFVESIGLELIFGLSPQSAENANSLVDYTAHRGVGPKNGLFAYSFGNEEIGGVPLAEEYLEKMTQVKAALEKAYSPTTRPQLVGPDVGVGPRVAGEPPSNAWNDTYINQHLQWIDTFTSKCGGVIDALTWHTYDFRAVDVGTTDHHPLPWPLDGVDNVSKLWDPTYFAAAGLLSDNVSTIAKRYNADLPVWLTETNSICHQGVFNATNAFLNSLWLVNRLGLMSERGVKLMGRQSLIGFNYSLLGNFPAEPIYAAPDYYTTVLFKRLTGIKVLSVTRNVTGGSEGTLQAYAYCSREFKGGVTVTLINLQEHVNTTVSLPKLGNKFQEYKLIPGWSSANTMSARDRATSRKIALNGNILSVDDQGGLPDFVPVNRTSSSADGVTVSLEPLSIAFVVFPEAQAPDCQ